MKKILYLIIILPIFLLFNSKVKAYSFGTKNGITIDENYIYQKFTESFPDFDIVKYSNIFCSYNSNNYIFQCYAVSPSEYNSVTVTPPSSIYDMYKFSEKVHYYFFHIDVSTGVINNKYSSDVSALDSARSRAVNYITSFNKFYDDDPFDYSSQNKLDFSLIIEKNQPIMKIQYLDKEYNVISSKNCINIEDEKCTFNVNSNNGKYIKVIYYMDKLIPQTLDIINGDKYSIESTLINSNSDVKLNFYNIFYKYDDDTGTGTEMIGDFPLLNPKITNDDNIYKYYYEFQPDMSPHSTGIISQIDIIYDFATTNITTIEVPYSLDFKLVTSSGGDLPEPPVEKDPTDEKLDNMNDKLDDLNSNLTDETLPDTSGYGDVAGWLPPGTIDTLINLPLTLFTTLNNSASETCKTYKLPFINNSTIELPCIGDYLSNLKGWGTLISFIDLAMAVILLYKLLMSLYKDIQKVMSLKDNDSDLGGVD